MVRQARPEVDGDLEQICARALATRPVDRYTSADSLAADLRAWLGREPIGWTRPTVMRRYQLALRRSPLAWGLFAGAITTLLAVCAVATYWVGHAEAERARAALALLQKQHAEKEERAKITNLMGGILTKYFVSGNSDSVPANWINAMTFLEAVLGPKLTVSEAESQLIWERRIEAAEDWLHKAEVDGTKGQLDPLLVESSLCLWLLRAGRGQDALLHLDRVEPRWSQMLDPGDQWLSYLKIFRHCADFETVDPLSPDARERRATALREAEEIARQIPNLGRPARMLLDRLKAPN
jgi:hypothetical protein